MLIHDAGVKQRIHAANCRGQCRSAADVRGREAEIYRELKLEGIIESPVNILITCDRDRAGPVVIGRTHIKAMDIYSSVCAVQNLWLAAPSARARRRLGQHLPSGCAEGDPGPAQRIIPIAYLCLGQVSHFYDKPELEAAGWRPRLPLDELVYFEQWGEREADGAEALKAALREAQGSAATHRRFAIKSR